MSKQIDPIKKELYKQARFKNKSVKQSLIDAGYSPNTASHSTEEGVVKVSEPEIMAELKAKDITVDWLIKKTETIIQKADRKGDITNQHRGTENIARFVGIDKPQSITNIWNINDLEKKDPDLLTKLAKKRLRL